MKLPSDLKPGTILHLRNGWMRIIERAFPKVGAAEYYDMVENQRPMTYWVCENGKWGARRPELDIIRIERISSKPKRAKVDKDAAWLRRLTDRAPIDPHTALSGRQIRRLRAIARRLEGKA